MSSYVIQENTVGWTPIEVVDTVQRHPLGTVVRASDPTYGSGLFVYVKGVDSGTANSWVTYNADDYSTALLVANAIGPVGIMMSALVASTFGWVQIDGKGVGKALTGFVDNANVYGTATAGSVDDAIVAGDRVQGAKGASAVGTPSAGLAEFEIHRPFVNDALAD
jgi:hypothetical protein